MNLQTLTNKSKLQKAIQFATGLLVVLGVGLSVYLLTNIARAAEGPTIESVTPGAGPDTGGQQVTITGTGFSSFGSPEDHTWANTGSTLPGNVAYSHLAEIGSKLYLFGGYQSTNNRAIYSADISDPTTWVDTGSQLPGAAGAGQLAFVEDKIYLFGGVSSRAIYSADISDPTTWVDTGKVLPTTSLHGSQLATVGDKLYLFGGSNTANIYSADISDPTTWVDTGVDFPQSNIYGGQLYMDDTNLYLFGGGTSAERRYIYTASQSDPTNWTLHTSRLPDSSLYGRLYQVGSDLYLTGGIVNKIYKASPSDPTSWVDTGKTMPTGGEGRQLAVVGDKAYLYGGLSSNVIYTANIEALEAYFGDERANILSLDKDNNSLVVETPAHNPAVVDVTLTDGFDQTVTLEAAYEFEESLGISSISPTSGNVAGGDSVSIIGAGYSASSEVWFGESQADTTFINDTTLVATVPPATSPGAVDVRVVDNGLEAALTDGFIYTGGLFTWTGAVSSDWYNPGNWSSGSTPDEDSDVVIEGGANQPELNVAGGSVRVRNLTVGESVSSRLTLSNSIEDNKIIISGNLTVGDFGEVTHTSNTTAHSHSLLIDVEGDVIVAGGGKINADSKGYNSARGPGAGGGAGSYKFVGGGYGGKGGLHSAQYNTGLSYGSVKEPTDIGSGGGPSGPAGSGGGAINISADGEIIVDGIISARGGPGTKSSATYAAGGSGGSIWLSGTSVRGSGQVTANGGSGLDFRTSYGGGGGGGRVAIYSNDEPDVELSARGGLSNVNANDVDGAAGTVFVKLPSQANGSLRVDNQGYSTTVDTPQTEADVVYDSLSVQGGSHYVVANGQALSVGSLGDAGSSSVRGSITVSQGGEVDLPSDLILKNYTIVSRGVLNGVDNLSLDNSDLEIGNSLELNNLIIGAGSVLSHPANGSTNEYILTLNVADKVVVDEGGEINASGRGFAREQGPGAGARSTVSNVGGGGAGYGGHGGEGGYPSSSQRSTGGAPYGSPAQPLELGSGGGNGTNSTLYGGAGGGAVRIIAGNSIEVNGRIIANGANGTISSSYRGGGGSGGSVYLTAPVVTGSGDISSNGGAGASGGGGGGSGGRIAIEHTSSDLAVDSVVPSTGSISGGNTVTIVGSGFRSDTTVRFVTTDDKGNVHDEVAESTVADDSTLTAVVPATPFYGDVEIVLTNNNLTGEVSVVGGGGFAAGEDGTISPSLGQGNPSVSTSDYQYLSAPSISDIAPNTSQRVGGDTVIITGSDFRDGATVWFGDLPADTIYVNSTTLSVVVPTAARAGQVDIRVANEDGLEDILVGAFSYIESPPAIQSVSPAIGPVTGGQRVVIYGDSFVAGKNQFVQVSAGSSHSLGLTSDGRVYAWGAGGRLGTVDGLSQNSPVPVDPYGELAGKRVVKVSAGEYHSLALTDEGKVYSWGSDTYGRLGDGSAIESKDTPVPVDTTGVMSGKVIVDIAAGNTHSLAVDSDGKVYSWGRGQYGVLGNGGNTDSPVPVEVDQSGALAGKKVVAVEAGSGFSFAITDDGLLYGWGENTYGRLGIGSTSNRSTPTAVGETGLLSGKQIASVSAGQFHAVALATDGGVYSWGQGTYGQLGQGQGVLSNRTSPVAVDTSGVLAGKQIVDVAAGVSHSAALGNDGQVYTWGPNASGQLGNGTTSSNPIPTPVEASMDGLIGSDRVESISAGSGYSLVIIDGDVYGWGSGNSGKIGDGDDANRLAPTRASLTYGKLPTVRFGDSQATVHEVNQDETSLTVTTPGHDPGMVDVTVTNYDGQSATLSDAYEFMYGPEISQVTPEAGSTAGGDIVVLHGQHFRSGANVTFGGEPVLTTRFIDENTLEVTTPAHTRGAVDVVVTNPDNQTATLQAGYAYLSPAPVINSVSSYEGRLAGGDNIVLQGSGFDSSMRVYFGGVEAATTASLNNTRLTAVLPAGQELGEVEVVVRGPFTEAVTLSDSFRYVPDQYVFTSDPLSLHETEPGAMTVEVRNASGEVITAPYDITLQLSSTSDSASFSVDGGETWSADEVILSAGESTVSIMYRDASKGQPTITATGPAGVKASQAAEIITRYRLLVTGVSNPIDQGVPSSVTIQAVDWKGNAMEDYTGTISFTSTDSFATIPQQFTITTSMQGRYTFVNGVALYTLGEQCVTATDISDSNITGSQCNIVVEPSEGGIGQTPTQLQVITDPQNADISQPSEAITIQTQDADGKPARVPVDYKIYAISSAGSSGQFSANGVNGWVSASQPFELTIPEGATFVNVYYRDSQAGTKTLSFRDQVGENDTDLTDTEQTILIGAGPPSSIKVSAPDSFPAATWRPITISLQDDQGRPATNKDHQIDLTLTASSPDVQLRAALNDETVTGQISTSIKVGGSSAVIYAYSADPVVFEVTASDGDDGLEDGYATIVITSSNPSRIRTTPQQSTAGANQPIEVRLQLEDNLGRPAALDEDRTISLLAPGGSFSLADDSWQPISSVVLPAGSHSVSVFYRSSQAGERTIRGSITLNGSNTLSHEAIVDILPGEYSRVGFSVGPDSTPVHDGSRYVVTIYDAYGNIATSPEAAQLYLYSSQGGEFASSQSGPWGADSVEVPAGGSTAEFWFRSSDLGSETVLTVSDMSPLDSPDVGIINAEKTISVVGQSVARLRFISEPQTITAGEVSQKITIQAQKPDGSPAILGEDTVISLGVNGAAGGRGFVGSALPGATTISSVTIPTGESGAEFYFHGEVAGEYELRAIGPDRTANQILTVEPAEASKLAFMAAPNVIVRNQPSRQIEIATVDAFGNRSSVNVDTVIQLDSSCDNGSSYSISANEWEEINEITIPAGGNNAFVYFMTDGWECELTLQAGGLDSATHEVQAVNGPHRLAVAPANSAMERGQSQQFTVSLFDEYGDVTLALAPTRIYLAADKGSLDSDSIVIPEGNSTATVTFTAEESGVGTLEARDQVSGSDMGLIDGSASIDIVDGQPAKVTISPPTSNMSADAVKSLTVELRNSYDREVKATSDTVINLATDGSGHFLASSDPESSSVSTVTVPAGESVAEIFYTQDDSGTVTVTATGDELDPGTALVYVGAAQIDRYVIMTERESAEIGEPVQVRIEARDVYGNVVIMKPGHNLYISASGVEAAISGGNYDQDTHRYTVQSSQMVTSIAVNVRALEVGNITVTASDSYPVDDPDQGIQNDTLTYQAIHGEPHQLRFVNPAYTIERGGVAGPIRLTLQNRYGIPIPATVDITADIQTTGQTGQFGLTTSGEWGVKQATIPAGESETLLYYRDNQTIGQRQVRAASAGLERAVQNLDVVYGEPVEAKIITPEQTLHVSHTSQPIRVALVNQFGYPTSPSTDKTIQLRSSSSEGQFMTDPTRNNWGVTSINWLAGRETATFYYRDYRVGTPMITVLGTRMNDASQDFRVVPQVFDHFVVTNIADPQRVGTATSVVVMAKDSAGYTVVEYSGTIEFSSTDPLATLPGRYTFNPAVDKGIHTFTNGVIFRTPGEHVVTVRDVQTGQSGQQKDITVTPAPGTDEDSGPGGGVEPGDSSQPGVDTPDTPDTPSQPGDDGGSSDPGSSAGDGDSSDKPPGAVGGSDSGDSRGQDGSRQGLAGSFAAGLAGVADFMTPLEVDFSKDPAAAAVATVFYSAQGVLIIALLREAYKEVSRVYHLRRLLRRQQQLAADKYTFLRLAGHYIRTPIAILEAAISTEASTIKTTDGLIDTRSHMLGQLQAVIADLRSRSEALLEGGAVSDLDTIEDPNIEKATRSAIRSPLFWLPVILSIALTVAVNWLLAATAAGKVGSDWLVYASIVAVALGLIGWFGYRTLQINRERKQLKESIEKQRQLLFDAKNNLIHQAEQALGGDVEQLKVLTTHPQIVTNDSLAGPIKDSIGKLTDLVTKLQLLVHINGVSPQANEVAVEDLVRQALYRHNSQIIGKQIKVDQELDSELVVKQDLRLLRYVVSTVMDNAVKFSKVGGKVKVWAQRKRGELIVRIRNDGGFGSEEAAKKVFEPFNHASNQDDLTAEGMGLSMYLNRLIVDQLGGEIRAIDADGGKAAEIEFRVPDKISQQRL